jgi:hypothetical protein
MNVWQADQADTSRTAVVEEAQEGLIGLTRDEEDETSWCRLLKTQQTSYG